MILPFTIYLFVLPAAMRTALGSGAETNRARSYDRLSAGLHTKTTEENIAVWALSREIRASGTLTELFRAERRERDPRGAARSPRTAVAFKAALDAFIIKYGHRGGAERDAIHRRWRHQPELVFHSLKPMLSFGDEEDPQPQEDRLHERMLEAKAGGTGPCRQGSTRGDQGAVRQVADRGRPRTTSTTVISSGSGTTGRCRAPRDIYTAIARKFIARGLIEDEEDIFFLGREEVVAVEEGRMGARDIALRVRARRRVYEKYSRREPPKYVQGWRTFDDDQLPDDGRGLRGVAASSGTVTGRARVCRTLEEVSRVGKGDILVTVATDPAWTTVFSFIGGVVVEAGGVVAHAVMISREYGHPVRRTSGSGLRADSRRRTDHRRRRGRTRGHPRGTRGAGPVRRPTTARERELSWAGCTNIRDLGGQPLEAGGVTAFGVMLRADNVRNLTDGGLRALVDYGVRRVVDLRWQEELDQDPPVEVPVEVVHVPLLGLRRPEERYVRFASLAAEVEDESQFARRLYGEYAEEFSEAFAAAVDAVASSPGPVLFHCTAGKDRTGLVAALVLRSAGVGIDAVAADYALTDASALLRRGLVDGMPEDQVRARTFLFSAPYDGMAHFLRDLEAHYGSAARYLEQAGLDPAAARELRRRLVPGVA